MIGARSTARPVRHFHHVVDARVILMAEDRGGAGPNAICVEPVSKCPAHDNVDVLEPGSRRSSRRQGRFLHLDFRIVGTTGTSCLWPCTASSDWQYSQLVYRPWCRAGIGWVSPRDSLMGGKETVDDVQRAGKRRHAAMTLPFSSRSLTVLLIQRGLVIVSSISKGL